VSCFNSAGLASDRVIPLSGYVALNHDAQAKLTESREKSSSERNRITAMDYRLALPQLARRLIYKSLDALDKDYLAAIECEKKTILEYLDRR